MILSFTKTPIAKYWPNGQCKAQLNQLQKEGIVTFGDVLHRTPAEIMRTPRFGPVGLRVLHEVLHQALTDSMRAYLGEVP